jgi:hypothetical protein
VQSVRSPLARSNRHANRRQPQPAPEDLTNDVKLDF